MVPKDWRVPTLLVTDEFPEERNSCTVRALSKIAGLSYEEAHKYLAGVYGRKNRCSVNWPTGRCSFFDLGFYFQWHSAKERKNLRNTLMPPRGVFLVYQTAHVLPVIDGQAIDVFDSSRKFVIGWWKVSQIEKSKMFEAKLWKNDT